MLILKKHCLGQLQAIRKMTFSRLICDTVGRTKTIQPNPFLQASVPGNSRKPCNHFPQLDLNPWISSHLQTHRKGITISSFAIFATLLAALSWCPIARTCNKQVINGLNLFLSFLCVPINLSEKPKFEHFLKTFLMET